MSLFETRYHFRVSVSDDARRVSVENVTLIALKFREETAATFWLRVLAWALFWTPGLRFGPQEPDEPDLFDLDPHDRKTVWVKVSPESAEVMEKAARHNRGAVVAAVFEGGEDLARFEEESRTLKGLENVEFLVVDPALLAAMTEAIDERRYDLQVTVVEDTVYLQVGKHSFSGTFRRFLGFAKANRFG